MPEPFLSFDHVLFYGREYQEVLEMVALTEADLKGKRILDCPSGPDAFVAEAHRCGFDVTGCDPLYVKSLAEIILQGNADIRACWEGIKQHRDQMGDMDIDTFHHRKFAALDVFAKDFDNGFAAGRYRAASLPSLPFENGFFDLVISANLLFAYSSAATGGISFAPVFDLEFHRRAVHELIRVCKGEVRLYPVMTNRRKKYLHPYAAQVIGQLAADGVRLTFAESTYAQSESTGHLVLIIDCSKTEDIC